jgi:hypothetical protein
MRVSKQLIIASFALLPILAFSQKRFAFDVRVSPDYTYRVMTSSGDPDSDRYKTYFDTDETSSVNGHIGVNVNIKLSSKIWLRTGLQLSKIVYSGVLKNVAQYVSQEKDGKLTTSSGTSVVIRVEERKLDYVFLNIPIACRFLFSESRIAPYVELGIAPAFHIGGNETYIVGKEQLVLPSYANSFSLFVNGGLGIQFKANASLNLFFQPTVQYQIRKNATFTYGVSQHLYSIGVELGVSKAF